MSIQMSQISVDRIFLDSNTPDDGCFEFTLDCGSVYFGAVYDGDGTLVAVDQYFFSQNFSRDIMDSAVEDNQLLQVDNRDFPAKTYLLSKNQNGTEWMRFHAVVPQEINSDYFYQKYIGE